MKYYLIEIAEGDAKIKGKAIYEFEDLNSAVASYHTKIGTAMKSDLYEKQTVMVISEQGGVHESNFYVAPGALEVVE